MNHLSRFLRSLVGLRFNPTKSVRFYYLCSSVLKAGTSIQDDARKKTRNLNRIRGQIRDLFILGVNERKIESGLRKLWIKALYRCQKLPTHARIHVFTFAMGINEMLLLDRGV